MATKKPAETAPPSPDMDARAVWHAPAAAAPKPKETQKRAKEPSPPPVVDVGARASGGYSPVRDALPEEGAAAAAPPPRKKSKTKKTTKRAKRSSPPSQEGRAQDGVEESGDPSLVSNAAADETAAVSPGRDIVASADHNKRGAKEDGAHEEEQQGEEIMEHHHAGNISPPQEKDEDAGAVVMSSEALSEGDASLPEQKKAAVERAWSQDDELKILNALVEYARSNGGAVPDSSHLLANLTFDKADANADKLNDKIRKLKTRYRKLRLQGRPTDNLGRRLFELSAVVWGGQGQGDDDAQAEATFVTNKDGEFSQRWSLYPYLAEEVKVYAKTHNSGDFIMAAFATIDDDTARHLDAMCKKQRADAFNLELSQANLTKAMLSAFSGHIN
ncbi:unnamed protein product [Urochloa decumbens]|uniref:Glabrous enhancer-binding protein-like DBD domain-containing protein n=1 Tax=Urochloa decumbens TaxID=240449 RepID=A0ABC9DBT4_9POAL